MRVTFFTDSFAPTHDGVSRILEPLGAALVRRGVDLRVVTVRVPGTATVDRQPDGVVVYRARSVPLPNYRQYRVALFPYAVGIGRPELRQSDVLHLHTPGPVGLAGEQAARRWGTPTVGTFHTNLEGMFLASPHGRVRRRLDRSWIRFARGLCLRATVASAPTLTAARELAEGLPADEARRVRVVGNGVDTDRFRPGLTDPDWRARLGTGDRPLVTYVGRLARDKGISVLLDAVARIPPSLDATFVVAGDGPERGNLLGRLATDATLRRRVRYLGPVAESEKPALLAQSHLFVLPSVADTSSVAVLEAMACGVAPVVTDRGGPAEIVADGETGTTVDPEDPVAIARAISERLADRAGTLRRAVNARRWVQEHASIERTADEYLTLYGELVRS